MVNVKRLEEAFLRAQFRASRNQQLSFLDVLLRLVEDGIQPSRVCEHIRDIGSPIERAAADSILRGLDEGRTIGDAMSRMFRPDIATAIASAEQSGGLAERGMTVLLRLREQQDAKRGVYAQLSWPAFYLLFTCGLLAGFALEVWPQFEYIKPLEGYAAILYQAGLFILAWWPLMVALPIVAFPIGRLALRRYTGPGRVLLDGIWPLSMYRDLLGANSLDDLGTLMAAGQEPRMAIETVSLSASPHARMYFATMQRRLDEGRNVAEILDVGLIARRYLAHLKLLAEHRNLRETISVTGAAARTDALTHVKTVARVLNIFGLAVVSTSFAALILGVYSTAQNVRTAATL